MISLLFYELPVSIKNRLISLSLPLRTHTESITILHLTTRGVSFRAECEGASATVHAVEESCCVIGLKRFLDCAWCSLHSHKAPLGMTLLLPLRKTNL